jgi:hypothetical protein
MTVTVADLDLVPLKDLLDAIGRRCDAFVFEASFKDNSGRIRRVGRLSGETMVVQSLAMSIFDQVLHSSRVRRIEGTSPDMPGPAGR